MSGPGNTFREGRVTPCSASGRALRLEELHRQERGARFRHLKMWTCDRTEAAVSPWPRADRCGRCVAGQGGAP